MPDIVFWGRVLPEARNVSIPAMGEFRYTEADGGPAAVFSIRIEAGRVIVVCAVADEADQTFNWAMVRAKELATAIVDALGFSRGWSLQVLFDFGVCAGERRPLVLGESSVAPLCTSYSAEVGFEETCQLLFKEFDLRFAFHDLVSSLGTLNYSAIAAGRAVEAVRNLIAGQAMGREDAWDKLRETLNLDRAYLQFVMNAALNPRHGRRGTNNGATQMEVTRRAWTVVNRYIEFRKRGGVDALPVADFPKLVDVQK